MCYAEGKSVEGENESTAKFWRQPLSVILHEGVIIYGVQSVTKFRIFTFHSAILCFVPYF